jgi:hypothetical protein
VTLHESTIEAQFFRLPHSARRPSRGQAAGGMPMLLTLLGGAGRSSQASLDAQGSSATAVFMHIYDGMPHPSTGLSFWDASAYTRVDANTIILSRFKAGKLENSSRSAPW